MGAVSRFLVVSVPRISCSFILRRPRARVPHVAPAVCFYALPSTASFFRGLHMSPSVGSPRLPKAAHPWPEWSAFINRISSSGSYNYQELHPVESGVFYHEFAEVASNLPENFLRAAQMCLSFSRDQPFLLGTLSRKDIEVVVENGTPFLFKDGSDLSRKLRSFLGSDKDVESQTISAHTIDLMKFLLSYASILTVPPFSFDTHYNKEIVEFSVRSLLGQLGMTISETGHPSSGKCNPSDSFGSSHYLRMNMGMKKGDWICPRCNFMNFARNSKCLECEGGRPMAQFLVGEWECPKCFFRNFSRNNNCLKCEEARPKRPTPTGGEWECPQCDFFNYRRNTDCLKCNFKRPGDGVLPEFNMNVGFRPADGAPENTRIPDYTKSEVSDEKTKAFFQKISGLKVSDIIHSSQARENPGTFRKSGEAGENASLTIRKKLEDIFGRTSVSERPGTMSSSTSPVAEGSGKITCGKSSGGCPEGGEGRHGSDDDASVCRNPSEEDETETDTGLRNERWAGDGLEGTAAVKEAEPLDMSEEAKTERWFKRVAQINDISELSEIPDEDFPTIMPLRKGVNRFVVSKRKTPLERRLTSTQYRKNLPLVKSGPIKFDDE